MKKIIFKESAYNYLPIYRVFGDESLDETTYKNYLEDFPEVEDIKKEIVINQIKRVKSIVDTLKEKYNYKCQLCEFNFKMKNGNEYCEAHHLVQLSLGGSQMPDNVIIVCPNHHRMLHYAKDVSYYYNNSNELESIQINGKIYNCKK